MTELPEQLRLVSVAKNPSLRAEIERIADDNLPLYTQVAKLLYAFQSDDVEWPSIYEYWPSYQFGLYDASGELVACGNSLPLSLCIDIADLPERGWDWSVSRGIADHYARATPNTLAALAIFVKPEYRGRGYGPSAIIAMRRIAAAHTLRRVIAPVRPSLKRLYPLVPINEYVGWSHPGGGPFDPWLRAHVRVGGKVIRPCTESMTFTGRVAEWTEWLGMQFPDSRKYVVPEMLSTLAIDVELDRGVYVEPNVWVVHEVGSTPPAGN